MYAGTLTTAVPPLGWAGGGVWTLAQTLPSPTIRACGLPPTSTVAVTWSLRSSIRTSVPSPPFATQTLSPSVAMAVGALPTVMVVITAPVAGSIDLTVPSSALATQTACFPTAMADGPRPTGIGVVASLAIDADDEVRFAVSEPRAAESLRRRSRCGFRVDPLERAPAARVDPRQVPGAARRAGFPRARRASRCLPRRPTGTRRTRETVSKVGLIRSSVKYGSFVPEPTAHSRRPATARLCAVRRA